MGQTSGLEKEVGSVGEAKNSECSEENISNDEKQKMTEELLELIRHTNDGSREEKNILNDFWVKKGVDLELLQKARTEIDRKLYDKRGYIKRILDFVSGYSQESPIRKQEPYNLEYFASRADSFALMPKEKKAYLEKMVNFSPLTIEAALDNYDHYNIRVEIEPDPDDRFNTDGSFRKSIFYNSREMIIKKIIDLYGVDKVLEKVLERPGEGGHKKDLYEYIKENFKKS